MLSVPVAASLALTGPQKAVLMLLSLDEATAGPILAEMDAEVVKKLRDAASGLRAVPTSSLDGLYAEFAKTFGQERLDAIAATK